MKDRKQVKASFMICILTFICLSIMLNHSVKAEERDLTGKQIITGFADFQITDHYLSLSPSERPSKEDLVSEMPSVLGVYLNNSSTITNINVDWFDICDNYDEGQEFYYQFSPSWDEDRYVLSDGIDLITQAPYIGVFFDKTNPIRLKSTSSVTGNSNETTIYNYFINTMKVNTGVACGVLANIQCESSFNPLASVIDTNGLTSYGICQWNGSRFTALKNYAGSNYTTINGQLGYLKYELENSEASAWNNVKGCANSSDGAYNAGYNWAKYFERCAETYNGVNQYKQRANLARDKYWPVYNGSHDPIGCVDSATATAGKITVSGWAFDLDVPTTPIGVHVYVGGPVGTSGAEGHALTANKSRPDVAQAYASSNVGNNHGFADTFTTSKSGTQDLYFYGINTGGGTTSPLLGKKTVTIPKDTTKPTISDVQVTNISSSGYTVTCTVSDNVGIKEVKFPTWTANTAAASEQDDLKWHVGTISGNKASYTVKTSEHNNETNINYVTHIYAYDKAGNVTCHTLNGLFIDGTPPIVYDVKLSNVSKSGFNISGKVKDRSGLDRVEVQTWTKLDGQDDLTGWNREFLADVNGDSFSYRVNASDHNNELGPYYVHLWAHDKFGNYLKYRVGAHLDDDYGYTVAQNEVYNGHTYILIDDVQFWTEAATYCQSVGGYLASINSQDENNFVAQMVSQYGDSCWIGATDQETEGTFVWDNGEVFEYTNWGEGKPDNRNATNGLPQDYVRMYPDGKWDDVDEPTKYAFICEIDSSNSDLSSYTVELDEDIFTYDGEEKKPEVTVKNSKGTLVEGTDYTVTYVSNVNAGTAKAIIEGKGNYTGKIEKNYTIEKASQWISASIGVDKIVVGDQFTISTSGIGDFTFDSDNKEVAIVDANGQVTAKSAGQAMVSATASGDENHESVTAYLTIIVEEKKTDISDCDIIINDADIVYDGEEKTPIVTVRDGTKELTLNEDYVYYLENNIDAGNATIRFEGTGLYSGSIERTFVIAKAEQNVIAFTESDVINVGESILIITDSQGTATYQSSDDSVAIVDSAGRISALKAGTATITVNFEGTDNYNPASTTIDITVEKAEGQGEGDHIHTYEYSVTTPATCEADGVGTFTCGECDDSYTQVIPATGHNWSKGVETKAPSCTEDGILTYTCENCGQTMTEDILATGHIEVIDEAVEATCASTGLTEGSHCLKCGFIIKAQEEIEKKEHRWGDPIIIKEGTCVDHSRVLYICENCSVSKIVEGDFGEHKYGEPLVVKEPTCKEEGKQILICENCDRAKTESIPKGNHTYGDWITVKESTITEAGLKERTCSVCGDKETQVIPKKEKASDQIAAENAISIINGLPATISASDEAAVQKARTAYNSLTVEQKKLVPESVFNKLTSAESKIATIKEEANKKKPVSSAPAIGSAITVSGQTVTVTGASTITYTKAPNKKSVVVPETVTISGKNYTVTAVGAKAFTGSKIRTVTIGKSVSAISKNAFAKSKVTKLIVKSKLLEKKTVKGSLKGSKIKKVQVKVGSKKVNKQFVKKYKKIFTKKNAGKKVTLK